MKRLNISRSQFGLTIAFTVIVVFELSIERAHAIVDAVVDPASKTFFFSGTSSPIKTPGSVFQWSSPGFLNGPQELFPANMVTLGGTPNDDGITGPSFMELDSTNNAMTAVLAFNFPSGGISGTMEGNPSVTFDYSVFSIAEQGLLETLAATGTTLFSLGGAEDINMLVVPEPEAMTLLGLGGLAILGARRRRKFTRSATSPRLAQRPKPDDHCRPAWPARWQPARMWA
jgi:hypothetical protein